MNRQKTNKNKCHVETINSVIPYSNCLQKGEKTLQANRHDKRNTKSLAGFCINKETSSADV
jgi:hypothetical protein